MTLEDKYTRECGLVYLTGIQALVRLPMEQVRRDRAAGLRTGAFISGYEGSPLGGFDLTLLRNTRLLHQLNICFHPGTNEELAATSVFGSQILHSAGGTTFDGITGIWYGKGPGVDRCGDIFRHANIAGTGPNCAALVLGGDDHVAKSSTIPHQSDLSFFNASIPVFYPGNSQEVVDYGLLAIAASRFSGAWVAMKMVTNICDGGGMVETDPARLEIRTPAGYRKHHDPRLVTPYTLDLEREFLVRRLEAVRMFARENRVNRMVVEGPSDRLGIVATGKSYYDFCQALHDCGMRLSDLGQFGIRVAKYALTFPLEPEFTREFARGLKRILVIEEKRPFVEMQLRDLLYPEPSRPAILGKSEELFPSTGELSPEEIVHVLARLVPEAPEFERRRGVIAEVDSRDFEASLYREPNFCPGCPHNRSTLWLENTLAGGGIGCHSMSEMLTSTGRGFSFLTQMGAEGTPFIGLSPWIEKKHMFQNIGDGTYFHSGAMAVNACIAAGINITFKILYNSAVAMTGGQRISGSLPVPTLARKLEAEGVRRIAVLTDDVAKYGETMFPSNTEVRHRDDLALTMREFERVPGVTVIIYDQQCAAEKRRLRSRGKLAEPVERLVIHERVCEGCGDCVAKSNCMSLQPVATDYGVKTRIHQPSCNKDYSCALGDCPSFVSVRIREGSGLRRAPAPACAHIPVPAVPVLQESYAILSPGIGGTGVVTINALLATAAWLDGCSALTLDQTGLAQKGGAVVSSVILSPQPIDAAVKLSYAQADLILGFDLVGAANADTLKRANPLRTVAVVNSADLPTGASIRGTQAIAGPGRARALIGEFTHRQVFVDASTIAESLFGSHLPVNVFLLGVAFQQGAIPLSLKSIEEAIRLNRVEAELNLEAFRCGRLYAVDPKVLEPAPPPVDPRPLVERRAADLVAYQDTNYAAEYSAFVRKAGPEFEDAVARNLYKLMAYKDEYEVARLLTDARYDANWEAVESVRFNLHPPLLRAFGWKKKISVPPAMLRPLAKLKWLRGTALDPFGRLPARREERELIVWYKRLVEDVIRLANPQNRELALEILSLPDQIRGYEDIKRASIRTVKERAGLLLAQLKLPILTTIQSNR